VICLTHGDQQFTPPPPPPVIAKSSTCSKKGKSRVRTLGITLLALALLSVLSVIGGRFMAERAEAQAQRDMALGDRIIGSWVLYMDNSGVGAYVNLKANGSLQLTEGRLGEWMTIEHRLIEAEGASYLEFYDADTNRWVRFMEITAEDDNQLRLVYLDQ
jgi:hypothetical protein